MKVILGDPFTIRICTMLQMLLKTEKIRVSSGVARGFARKSASRKTVFR